MFREQPIKLEAAGVGPGADFAGVPDSDMSAELRVGTRIQARPTKRFLRFGESSLCWLQSSAVMGSRLANARANHWTIVQSG